MTFSQMWEERLSNVKRMSPFEVLVYWIKERESIRIKKEAGQPKPWTTDKILQTYRFCNVIRMEDKVSQWLLNNWYTPSNRNQHCLVAVVLARHINLPSTLERIGYPSGNTPIYAWLEKCKKVVRSIQASGGTAYNGAYMVRGNDAEDKIAMITDNVCKPIVNNPPSLQVPCLMQQSVEVLLPYYGLGSFMAGQVVADLRWFWPPIDARKDYWADRFDYAPIGPGSLKGMNYLHGRPAKQLLKQVQFQQELVELRDKLNKYAAIKHVMKRAEAMDIQNCLCEYRAYYQALHGIKMPKRRY